MRTKQYHNPMSQYPQAPQQPVQQPQYCQFPQQQRAGDWKCVVCCNINFSFRNECNRCGLISKEQNDHHNTMIAYGGVESAGKVRRKLETSLRAAWQIWARMEDCCQFRPSCASLGSDSTPLNNSDLCIHIIYHNDHDFHFEYSAVNH